MEDTLTKLQETVNSNLPIATFVEKFITKNNNNNNNNNNTNIVYNVLIGIVQLVICIYTLYTIWKCLQVKDGNDYKYGLCEFVLAICCLPCYLFWRTFITRCDAPKVNTLQPSGFPARHQSGVLPLSGPSSAALLHASGEIPLKLSLSFSNHNFNNSRPLIFIGSAPATIDHIPRNNNCNIIFITNPYMINKITLLL